jgi:hypothetical protein
LEEKRMSVWVGIAILIPVVGALLYAIFATEGGAEKKGRRMTAFGEAPEDDADDLYRRIA